MSEAAGPLRAWVRSVLRRGQEARLQRDLAALLRELDTPRFRDIATRYRDASPAPGYSKYLEPAPWVEARLRAAYALGLADGRARRVLDIGTGNGYFPLVCRHLGHEVLTIDLDVVPMYNEVIACLGLPRRVLRVQAYEPLPDLGGRFDLITAFMVCFNDHNLPTLWAAPEWEFFLTDLVRHHLAPGGRVFLWLNAEAKTGLAIDDPLRAYLLTAGARIEGNEVQLDEPTLRRSLPGLAGLRGPPGLRQRTREAARRAVRTAVRRWVDPPRAEPYLVLREREAAWSRLLPAPAPPAPRLLGSFPIPADDGACPPVAAREAGAGLAFDRAGEHYLRTSAGALKLLVLDPARDADAHLLDLFAFFARNLVHTRADAWRPVDQPDGLFGLAVGEVRPDKLLEKLFWSDQPLGLHCGQAVQALNDLIALGGGLARCVELRDARGRGHVVSEAFLPVTRRWVMLDPDYGAYCTDERDQPLSIEELARATGPAVRVHDVARKRWLRADHDPAPDPRFAWTPALSSDRRTIDEPSYLALLRSCTAEARVWRSRDRFTLELDVIRRPS